MISDVSSFGQLPPLTDVIRRYELAPKKSLGQHFLIDPSLLAKVVRQAGDLTGRTVIEIGPGPGGLTRALLQAGAKRVIAVEKDQRAIAALKELESAAEGRLAVREADALQVEVGALGEAPRKMVANLPYNISTELVFRWLPRLQAFESLTLMFQKEVAERIAASHGNKTYGKLSVMVQALAEVTLQCEISPKAFMPPPKVTSTVVTLVPRKKPLIDSEHLPKLKAVCGAAFGQRRKMLRSSLKALNADTEAMLEQADIEPTLRAEQLSVSQFCALAQGYSP